MSTPSPKANDTPEYSGIAAPSPTEAGLLQTGGWADDLTSPPWWNRPTEVYEGLPACVRVTLSGVTQIGPNQYRTTLRLGETLQLTPDGADAHQNRTVAVAPNTFTFSYRSRNSHVATVDAGGVVTAVNRGECEIIVQSPRAVNANLATASPSGTDGVQASLLVTVTA